MDPVWFKIICLAHVVGQVLFISVLMNHEDVRLRDQDTAWIMYVAYFISIFVITLLIWKAPSHKLFYSMIVIVGVLQTVFAALTDGLDENALDRTKFASLATSLILYTISAYANKGESRWQVFPVTIAALLALGVYLNIDEDWWNAASFGATLLSCVGSLYLTWQ